ncbi:dihydroxyacetone kinase subunit L [Erysipelothrix sp. HDW6C]|uniref:dihydroxyacetone kinase subunit DhaL n=1 Tax=Erysipelothrix sp. HDW6C TaxID=2714930 RepID=UPI00140E691D|nr:dihydroxyacetone kinase subunit DhaL [Erysipelothrix sp. HDW6C]QIK70069.1 dihydroxyacetone kinase subunit L [Erysipelothrix sp. HDW6C]
MISTKNPQLVRQMIATIDTNSAYLSEIDGYIGDGDHGNNMKKGFLMAQENLNEAMGIREAIQTLALILIDDIGGSMGPIYGTLFRKLSMGFKQDTANEQDILDGLVKSYDAICDLAGAKPGDKTLIDTLSAAILSLQAGIDDGLTFSASMEALKAGANRGWEATKNMQARLGRASRLGERSVGFYDAGATSCKLLIETLADYCVINDLSEKK